MPPGIDLSNNFRRIRCFLETPEPEQTVADDDLPPPSDHLQVSESRFARPEDDVRELSVGESEPDPDARLMAEAKRIMLEIPLVKTGGCQYLASGYYCFEQNGSQCNAGSAKPLVQRTYRENLFALA